jgi:hypothetical protein
VKHRLNGFLHRESQKRIDMILICIDCKREFEISDSRVYCASGRCKNCKAVYNTKQYHIRHPNKGKAQIIKCREAKPKYDWPHSSGRVRFMSEAKDCSMYLGVYIAEKVLSNFFDTFERMPMNNPGYDYVCGKGFKIDVKSSCLNDCGKINRRWMFNIEKNKIPDYFLCLGFDNRESLEPQHIWLIPSKEINCNRTISITNVKGSLDRMMKYERSLDRVIECCNKLRQDAD